MISQDKILTNGTPDYHAGSAADAGVSLMGVYASDRRCTACAAASSAALESANIEPFYLLQKKFTNQYLIFETAADDCISIFYRVPKDLQREESLTQLRHRESILI